MRHYRELAQARSDYRHSTPSGRRLTRGMFAVGIFLLFGFAMAALAGTTLLWKGTVFDRMWALNPRAYEQLAPLGRMIGVPFLFLSAALFVAATGWFRRRLWAWRLTVLIIAGQVIGDLFNALRGEVAKGIFGAIIACALLMFLLLPGVRTTFDAK